MKLKSAERGAGFRAPENHSTSIKAARPRLAVAVTALALLAGGHAQAQALRAGYNRDVIYQVFVDRFFDGTTVNNPGGDPLFDGTKSNLQKYQGGDFQGLTQKIPYLKNMGITSIWITSPLDNRNISATNASFAPYHGYEMRDTLLPDEHFTTSARSWQPFDDFVTAAHNNGIKVIVDFAPNHSNVRGQGENGALYANNVLQANYTSNPGGNFFNTAANMGGAQFDAPYETQYFTLFDLSDLNQTNASVDALLKASVNALQNRGVDGFRIDATKHVNWGWQYSLANSINTLKPAFIFGEWVADDSGNPLYGDLLKFSNRSGIAELNFPLFTAITTAFAQGGSFASLNSVLNQQQGDFLYQNDLVNFVDNHDRKRFLTVDTSADDQKHLEAALAFVMTARGIPCIYYGSEQYMQGGDDPDNRRFMTGFSETTTAFQTIKKLSTLRGANEALGYGGYSARFVSQNVLIFERKFYDSVVVVAINKGASSQTVSGFSTSLPTGSYADYLSTLSGVSLSSGAASGGFYNAASLSLPANSVSVWQRDPSVSVAQLGNVTPTAAQPGVKVTIAGQGFGASQGTVKFGTTTATVQSWNDNQIVATVPNIGQGSAAITVSRAGSSTASNAFNFGVYQAKLIPITFTVYNAAPTNPGDNIYLTGNTFELSNWQTTKAGAVGPMLTTAGTYPNWWLTVSVPAGKTIQFKAIRVRADGTVTWENGANHSFTVPSSGTGFHNFNWQY
jgi:glycosidase